MLNRLFANRWNRWKNHRPTWEILSLSRTFLHYTLTARSPASVQALDEFVEGYETYVYYDQTRLNRLDRALVAFLERCYVRTADRLTHVRTSAAFMRRCKRAAHSLYGELVEGRADATPVVFTLTSWPGLLRGPGGIVVTTLLNHHCIGFGSGATLHVAPRWFHEILGHWPDLGVRDRDDLAISAFDFRSAGIGPAFPLAGVDLDALLTLWDSDPSHLYCDLNEVLPALERL